MRVDKISASGLEKYIQCPHRYYLYYHTDRKKSKLNEDVHLHRGIVIHSFLEKLRTKYPDGDADYPELLKEVITNYDDYNFTYTEFKEIARLCMKWVTTRDWIDVEVVDTEMYFDLSLRHYKLHGYIDVIEKVDDEHYRVRDYKTGSTFKNLQELKQSNQLKMYAIATMQEFDVDNVEVAFDQIRFEPPEFIQYTKDELREFLRYVNMMAEKIEDDTTHKSLIGWYCGWCEYNNSCEALLEYDDNLDFSIPFEKVVEKYNECKNKSKTLSNMADKYKEEIINTMGLRDIDEVDTDRFKVTKRQNAYEKVDASKVIPELPPSVLNDVVSVNMAKLEKIETIDKEDLNMRVAYSKPYLYLKEKD